MAPTDVLPEPEPTPAPLMPGRLGGPPKLPVFEESGSVMNDENAEAERIARESGEVQPDFMNELVPAMATGGATYVGGRLVGAAGKRIAGKAGEVIATGAGGLATGPVARGVQRLVEGEPVYDRYEGLADWGMAAGGDLLDAFTGGMARKAVVGDLITPEIDAAMQLAIQRGLLKQEAYELALKTGKITPNTEDALRVINKELTGPKGLKEAQFEGDLAVNYQDTLRTAALARDFEHNYEFIKGLPDFKAPDVYAMAKGNEAAIKDLNESAAQAVRDLDASIEGQLPDGFRTPEYKYVKHDDMDTIRERVPKKPPEDVPGTVTLKDVKGQLAGLEADIKRLRAQSKGKKVKDGEVDPFKDKADEMQGYLDRFYARFDNNDGIMLPGEILETNRTYNEIRRTVEEEFVSSMQGAMARGDHGKNSAASEALSQIQKALKNAFAKKSNLKSPIDPATKQPKYTVDAEQLRLVNTKDTELAARYVLDTALNNIQRAIKLGVSLRPGSAVSQTPGMAPKSSLFNAQQQGPVGLLDRGIDAMRVNKQQHLTTQQIAERERALDLATNPLSNIRATQALEGTPVTVNRPGAGRLIAGELAGIAGGGASEVAQAGIGQVFGPADAFAMDGTLQPPTQMQAMQASVQQNQQNPDPFGAVMSAPNDAGGVLAPVTVEGPGDFFQGTPEPVAPPVPDFDFPRNTDEFTQYITPEMLAVFAPGKEAEYTELLMSDPSQSELEQFVSKFAIEQPMLFEPSPEPGYKSIVNNKVTDPAEQELYRAEVISKIESNGERIKAKSQFNKDFSIQVTGKRNYKRGSAAENKITGSGTKSDTSADRAAAAEKRQEQRP